MTDNARASEQDPAITLDASGERPVARLDSATERYAVGGLVGQGGMGDVRLATDRQSGRDVALKVVRWPELAPRFLREAAIQGQLEHPGIVPIFDIDRTSDGRVFFTMKRIDGVDLAEIIARVRGGDTAFTPHALISAFLKVCLTVAYAHARGVLHRDLKPANIMLGAYGEVYVLDWGISKARDDEDVDTGRQIALEVAHTVTGATLGTPAYMSPERIAGAPADERSDVFALGAILYELLAHVPLVDEECLRDIARRKRASYDARPSIRRPSIAPELDAICLRATAINPRDRFKSARALHDAVAAHFDADRDAVTRERLAAEHERRAEAASERGSEAEALAEIGQALALDPDAASVRACFGRLMAAQKNPPAAVVAEVDAQRDARVQRMTPSVVISYALCWCTIYPVVIWLAGMRSVSGALAPVVAWMIAAVTALVAGHVPTMRRRFSFTGLATLSAVAITTVCVGPFFMLPHAAAVAVIGFILADPKGHRTFLVIATIAALLVPTALAWTGVHDIYRFTSDGIELHGAVHTPPAAFYFGLTAAELVVVGIAFMYASRYRTLLDRAKLSNAVVAWQLEKVMSEGPRREPQRQLSVPSAALDAPVVGHAHLDCGASRYERLEEIGPGVFRAFDRKLSRQVQLTVHDSPSAPALRQAVRMLHPAITPLYDVGVADDGRPFSVSRLRRGRPLTDVACGASGLLDAFGEVCLAVAFAHREGVAHGSLGVECVEVGAYGEAEVVGWKWEGTAQEDVKRLGPILRAMAGSRVAPELEAIAARAERGEMPSARALHDEVEAYRAGERDGDLRLRLARSHVEHAEAATRRAVRGDDESRAGALREAGRALALGDRAAGELFVRLLTTPPEHAPAEVVERVAQLDEVSIRRTRLLTAGFCAFWITLYPLVGIVVGIRDLRAVILLVAVWLLAEMALLAELLFGPKLVPLGIVATMTGAAACTTVVGPFFFVGVLVTVITMTRTLTVPRRWWWLVVASACAAIIVPTVLAWTEIHPIYAFESDVLHQSGALMVDKTVGFLCLTCAHLLAIVFAAGYAARFRDTLDRFETKNMYVMWKLTRLLQRPK